MTLLSQPQVFGTQRLIAHLWHVCAGFVARFSTLFDPRPDVVAAHSEAADAVSSDSQMLRQAVFASSPHEVDWLLYAAMMTDTAKQRYCLERALAINPDSDLARRALARLAPHN